MDRMPTELLQRIAESTETKDILNFRRTCKLIEKETFDVFADAYLSRRECFVLNLVSLRNLEALVFQPSLSERICTLTLTLNPYPAASVLLDHGGSKWSNRAEKLWGPLNYLYNQTYKRHCGAVDRALVGKSWLN